MADYNKLSPYAAAMEGLVRGINQGLAHREERAYRQQQLALKEKALKVQQERASKGGMTEMLAQSLINTRNADEVFKADSSIQKSTKLIAELSDQISSAQNDLEVIKSKYGEAPDVTKMSKYDRADWITKSQKVKDLGSQKDLLEAKNMALLGAIHQRASLRGGEADLAEQSTPKAGAPAAAPAQQQPSTPEAPTAFKNQKLNQALDVIKTKAKSSADIQAILGQIQGVDPNDPETQEFLQELKGLGDELDTQAGKESRARFIKAATFF
jgi:hypothetical protein